MRLYISNFIPPTQHEKLLDPVSIKPISTLSDQVSDTYSSPLISSFLSPIYYLFFLSSTVSIHLAQNKMSRRKRRRKISKQRVFYTHAVAGYRFVNRKKAPFVQWIFPPKLVKYEHQKMSGRRGTSQTSSHPSSGQPGTRSSALSFSDSLIPNLSLFPFSLLSIQSAQ